MEDRCAKQVRNAGTWPTFHQCRRTKNLTLENGKYWCKQHLPSFVQQKRDEKYRKFKLGIDQRITLENRKQRGLKVIETIESNLIMLDKIRTAIYLDKNIQYKDIWSKIIQAMDEE